MFRIMTFSHKLKTCGLYVGSKEGFSDIIISYWALYFYEPLILNKSNILSIFKFNYDNILLIEESLDENF